MFEYITRTLDTDRKSIPEQINVLRFFKVFIYTRKLKFRNLSNNKFFLENRLYANLQMIIIVVRLV